MNAFEKNTLYRLLVEAVRYWVIQTFFDTKQIPQTVGTFWIYPRGIEFPGIDWGDDPSQPDALRPLMGKRIRVTLTVEDY